MPRFFDDYSNTYLTHDSSAGRKQQRRGWKFRENFKLHYESHLDDWRKTMGLASAQQAYIKAHGKDHPSIPPLPDGWKEDADEVTGGMTFYYNDETGERTWIRPNFLPPVPPPMRGGGPPPPQGYRNSGGHRHQPPQPPPFHRMGGGPGGPPPPPFPGAGMPPPPHQQHQQPQYPPPPRPAY